MTEKDLQVAVELIEKKLVIKCELASQVGFIGYFNGAMNSSCNEAIRELNTWTHGSEHGRVREAVEATETYQTLKEQEAKLPKEVTDPCPECGCQLESGYDTSGWEFSNGGSVMNEDWDDSPIITECTECDYSDGDDDDYDY